jgi:DNA segregation ATPase FtsK/SpoIIIE-like protein
MSTDDLGQMRKEIERLADAIERLEVALASRQDTTDAIFQELQTNSETLEGVGEVLDRIGEKIGVDRETHRGLLQRASAYFYGKLRKRTVITPDEHDPLYDRARECVIEAGKASTSFLQRRLGVGYSRAARLIDMLEMRGVVGPYNGAEPRKITLREQSEHTTKMTVEALREVARESEGA